MPKWLKHVLMAEAGDGSGGGGADDAGSAGADQGQADAGAGAADTGAAAGAENALAQGKESQAAEALAIPEKYQVKKEGTDEVDVDASLQKLLQGHQHLEKRVGAGDAPPKAHTDYEVKIPDAFKDVIKPAEDPALQSFLEKAHANGYTQKQIDLAMESYFEIAPQLVAGSQLLSADECIADLKKTWASDQQFNEGVKQSYVGLSAYAGAATDSLMKKYGNDPEFIRAWNAVGKDVGEDKSVNNDGGGLGQGETVEVLMASKAYTDPKDPQHAAVSAKVSKYFEAQTKNAEKEGRVAIL